MERDGVRPFWDLDQDGIVCALVGVVFGELYAKASGLDANRRIALRIESGRAAQDLCRDLVFLQRDPRVIEGMFSKVAKQLAQRFRAVQAMAFCKSLYLLEALLPTDRK